MIEVCEVRNAEPDILKGFRFVQTVSVPLGVIAIHPEDFMVILNRMNVTADGYVDIYKSDLEKELSSGVFTGQ